MRAELVAIHTALTTFAALDWIGIFRDSLSNLKAIDHHNTKPSLGDTKHYHHHMLFLHSITELLDARASLVTATYQYRTYRTPYIIQFI